MADLAGALDLAQACSSAAYDLLQDRYPGLDGDQLRFEVRGVAQKLVDLCNRTSSAHRAAQLLPVVLRRNSLPPRSKANTDATAQWVSRVEQDLGVILRAAAELVQKGAVAS